MSKEREYKYDVAFLLLSRDVDVAQQLAHQLAPLKCFVYTTQQRELVGRNGVEAFAETFRKDARLAVVLFREGYGDSEYTDLEIRGIQDRAMECRWQSPLLINLDNAPVPSWFPRRNIWLDLKRYSLDEAVGAIRLRSEELGASTTLESAGDYLARMSQHAADVGARRQHEQSAGAAEEVGAEVKHLLSELKRRYDEMAPPISAVRSALLPLQHTGAAIATGRGSLVVRWSPEFSNSLQDATLYVEIYDGYVSIGDRRAAREGKVTFKDHYTPSFDVGQVWRWVPKVAPRRYSSEELLESLLKQLFACVFRD